MLFLVTGFSSPAVQLNHVPNCIVSSPTAQAPLVSSTWLLMLFLHAGALFG